MKPLNTNDTPRIDSEPSNQPMLSAQSDPVELYHKLIAVTLDFGKALDACVEYREELAASKAEVERLRSTMRSFIDFMDDNLGTTADWPMEASFDDEETCQKHCDHINAMKRIVKPEDIN